MDWVDLVENMRKEATTDNICGGQRHCENKEFDCDNTKCRDCLKDLDDALKNMCVPDRRG